MYQKIKDFQITIVAIILFLALVTSTIIINSSIKKDTITVTGSASKTVVSDIAVLNIELKSTQKEKNAAYNIIKSQIPIVKEYLIKDGIKDNEIKILTPNSYPTYKTNPQTGYTTNIIDGYVFTQQIQIKTNDVNNVNSLSTSAQSLLSKGIDLSIENPEYYYSKLSEIKIELLKQASEDAKQRAKGMLSATNNSVGKIQSVKMGVFQITPIDSTDVSDSGMSDNTSIEKKVTAVANVSFRIK